MTKDLIGFVLVIISALPMGMAEGKIIAMHENYTSYKIAPMILLYLFGVALYLVGFMQIPTKIGFIVGVWEIAAVTIAIAVPLVKNNVKWDWEYFILFVVIVGSTYLLGAAADRILSKVGIH